MPQQPHARRNSSKPMTDREVAQSNDTARAFLGPRRKPAWLNGNRAKPSANPLPPPQPVQQIHTEPSLAVLPSPAPSDEPSPAFSSVLDSPNASSSPLAGSNVATQNQAQPALPTSLPYTTATFARASPAICDPIQQAGGAAHPQEPSREASQPTMTRPTLPPTAPFPNPSSAAGATRSFTFPLPSAIASTFSDPQANTQAGSPGGTSRTSTPSNANPAKRRRVDFVSADLLPRLEQQIRTVVSTSPSATPDLVSLRCQLLKDACSRDDGFFLMLHQLLCAWSCNPRPVYQQTSQLSPVEVDAAFNLVQQWLKANNVMRFSHMEWFANFPAPLNIVVTQMPSYSRLIPDVTHFLTLINKHWSAMLKMLLTRQFPFVMNELVAMLNCRSPVLQDIIFTSSRRNLGLDNAPFATELDSLFKNDRQSRSLETIEFLPAPTPQDYNNILSRNATLIACYRDVINRQRQQQAASAPQRTRPPQHSPPLVQSPSHSMASPFPLPTLGSNAPPRDQPGPHGQPVPQFASRPPEMATQPVQVQQVQPPRHGQLVPPAALMNSVGLFTNQQGGSTTSPLQSPVFGQGPFQNMPVPPHAQQLAAESQRQRQQQLQYAPNPMQPTPQRRSQTWHPLQIQTQQQLAQQQLAQQQFAHQQFAQQNLAQQNLAQQQIASQQLAQQQLAQQLHLQQLAQQQAQQQQATAVRANPGQRQRPRPIPNPISSTLANGPGGTQIRQQATGSPGIQSPMFPAPSAAGYQLQRTTEPLLFPPKGFRILRSEYPYDKDDQKSLTMSLHQAHLRSPKRVLRPGNANNSSAGPERFYQTVRRFAIRPTHIPPSQYIYRFNFDVDQESFASLETSELPSGDRLPQANYFQGSLRYRLRCIRRKAPHPDNTMSMTEAAWTTSETIWPTHIVVKLNNDSLTLRRQAHNGKDLPLELTTLIKAGDNRLYVSFPPGVNPTRRGGYFLAVEIIETSSHSSLIDFVRNNNTQDAQVTKDTIKTRLDRSSSADDGLVIVEEGLSIDLADPFTAKIFDVPVRGAHCTHLECFDLETWLQTRPPANKPVKCAHRMKGGCACNNTPEPSHPDRWKCPICDMDARPQSLRVDGFLLDVRRRLEAEGKLGAKAVLVMPDGRWTAVVEDLGDDDDDDGSDGDGQDRRDGSVARRRSAARPSADRGASSVEVVELLDDDD